MSKAASAVSAPKANTPRIPKKLKELATPIFEFLDARVAEKRTDAERRPFKYEQRLTDDKETIQVDIYFGPRVAAELDINSNSTFRWKVIGGGEKVFRSPKSFLKTAFNLRVHGDTEVTVKKVAKGKVAANDDSVGVVQPAPEEKLLAKKKVTAKAKAATAPGVTNAAAVAIDPPTAPTVVESTAKRKTRRTKAATVSESKPLPQPQLIPMPEAAKPATKRKVPAKSDAAQKTTQRRKPSSRNQLQQNLPL